LVLKNVKWKKMENFTQGDAVLFWYYF